MGRGGTAYYPVSLLPDDEDTPGNAAHAYDEPVDEEGIRIRNEQSASQQDDADPNGQTAQNSEDQDPDGTGYLQESQTKAHGK